MINLPIFGKIDQNKSVMSNFKILDNNWEILKKYLNRLQEIILEIGSNVDVDILVQRVLENISSVKIMFELDPSITETTQTIGGITYKLEKINNDTLEISKADESNWDLNQSLFQCKDINGNIVYPNIKIYTNKLSITFNDWNTTKYHLVVM